MPDVKAASAAAETWGLGTSPPVRFTVCLVGDVAGDADTAASAATVVAADLPTPPPLASELARGGGAPPLLPSLQQQTNVQPSSQSAALARRHLVSQMSRTSRTSESNRSNRSFQSNFSDLTCPSEDGVGILSLANDVNSILGSSILLSNVDFTGACSGGNAADCPSTPGSGSTYPRDSADADGCDDFGCEEEASAAGGHRGHAGHGAMVDLIDNPEYIDTLEGRLPLAEAAKMIARDSLVAAVGSGLVTPESVKRECYSKLLAVSVCFMFLHSAFFACRNLQTSLTAADEALGQQTLAALYALSWLGAVCGYPLMLVLRPAWAIVASMLPCLLYVAANFFQAPYTLLPAALLQGLALGVMWAAEGVYMVNLAAVYAATFGESYYSVVARFNTIFYTIYQASCVVGNVVSSIVLDQVGAPAPPTVSGVGAAPTNGSALGAAAASTLAVAAGGQLCGTHATLVASGSSSQLGAASSLETVMDQKKHFTLLAVLGAFVGCGVLTAAMFLRSRRGDGARLEAVTASHLPLTKRKSGPAGRALRLSLLHLGRVLVDVRMLLVAPCILYLGFSGSLMYGDYSKAFISCQYGIGTVGYIYLVGAVFGVAGSFLSGLLSRRIGRVITVSAAIIISAGCLLVLRFWEPETHITVVAFIPPALWFFSDAIISSLLNALLGVLFKERLLAASAAFLLIFGGGIALGALGSAFTWLAIIGKTYVAAALLVAGLAGYIVLELLIRRRASLLER